MKTLYRMLILGLLAACTTLPEVTKPSGPQGPSLEELLSKDPSSYPNKGWHDDYSLAIELAAKKYGLKAPCDNPVLLIKSMSKAESSWNRFLEFKEPAPLIGVISTGMMQISLNSSKSYKCGLKVKEDLYHPIKNLVCGVLIIKHWQDKKPGTSIYWQAGTYFAVMRNPGNWPNRKSYSGYEKVKKYSAENGCVMP